MSARRGATGLRWAIACRISGKQGMKTGDDDTDTVSLDTQEERCRAMIASIDPTGIIDESLVIREVHTSLDLLSARHDLSRLRAGIRAGRVDAVACYHPWRWTRDPDHAGALNTELREYGVRLRFVIEDPGEGSSGQIVGYVTHWSGKQYSQMLTEQTHRSRVQLVHRGQAWAGPKAPYGLRWRYVESRRADGRIEQHRVGWEEDPLTAPVLRRIFDELLRGISLRQIARDLTEDGIPSPKGRSGWSHIVVKQLLRNRAYTGAAYGLQNRTDRDSEYVGIRGKSRGRRKYRPVVRAEDEWVKLPDGYAPCLIPVETFEVAQQLLAGKRPGGRQLADPTVTLMAGRRTRCADCGRAMTVRRRAGRAPVLLCSGRSSGWLGCPGRPSIRCAEVDAEARRLARLVYRNPEVVEEQAEQHRANDPTGPDLVAVEGRLAEIEREQQSLTMVARQIVDPDAAAPLVDALSILAKQKRGAEELRAGLLARRAGWEQSRAFLDGFARSARRVAALLEYGEHADWQAAIDALGITAVVQRAPAGAPITERVALTMEVGEAIAGARLQALVERLEAANGPLMERSATTSSHEMTAPGHPITLVWTPADLDRAEARFGRSPHSRSAPQGTPAHRRAATPMFAARRPAARPA